MIVADWHAFLPERERLKAAGRQLVFTNGCFDLLHLGRLASLETARKLCNALIVAINTNASVRQYMGPERPIVRRWSGRRCWMRWRLWTM